MENDHFGDWLQQQLNERDWTQADLVRQSKITSAGISRIMTGQRLPGKRSLGQFAHALRLPPETLYRAAGLLPPERESTPTLDQANYLLALLPEQDQEEVLALIQFRLERKARHENDRKVRLGGTE